MLVRGVRYYSCFINITSERGCVCVLYKSLWLIGIIFIIIYMVATISEVFVACIYSWKAMGLIDILLALGRRTLIPGESFLIKVLKRLKTNGSMCFDEGSGRLNSERRGKSLNVICYRKMADQSRQCK